MRKKVRLKFYLMPLVNDDSMQGISIPFNPLTLRLNL